MCNKKEIAYSEYVENSKKLFKLLFGEKLFNKLNNLPLKTLDWDGLDIECCKILAVTPNIKERFSEEWIKIYKEDNRTLLDLYIQTVFHYGYEQSYNFDRKEPYLINSLKENTSEKQYLKSSAWWLRLSNDDKIWQMMKAGFEKFHPQNATKDDILEMWLNNK